MRQTQEQEKKEAQNYREYVSREALKVLIRWKLATGEISFS